MNSPDITPKTPPFDPTFLHTRREAWRILGALLVCLAWTIGYCAVTGYGAPTEEIPMTFGMPSWVFWGVLLPWGIATVFSVCFALFYIADDDLGETDPVIGPAKTVREETPDAS